jgi:hypothetical protein
VVQRPVTPLAPQTAPAWFTEYPSSITHSLDDRSGWPGKGHEKVCKLELVQHTVGGPLGEPTVLRSLPWHRGLIETDARPSFLARKPGEAKAMFQVLGVFAEFELAMIQKRGKMSLIPRERQTLA